VRGTTHPNDEAVSTCLRDVAVLLELSHLLFDHPLPEEVTVRVKLIGLDLPQHTRADLQRIISGTAKTHRPIPKAAVPAEATAHRPARSLNRTRSWSRA